jgi:hypothetical protein
MLTTDELEQISTIGYKHVSVVREELAQVEKRLGRAITESSDVLLNAFEINGREQMQLEEDVKRIKQHLNLHR